MPKFLRRNWTKHSRIGKGRKNKQTWRRAKGRHNKIREKRKGYPIKVMIGFRGNKDVRGFIEDKKPILVNNLIGLEKIQKGETAVIGKVGNKKRIEMMKKAKEKGIHISNININKRLKKIDKNEKKKAEESKVHNKKESKEEKKK